MAHLCSHTEPPKFASIDSRGTQPCGSSCTQHLRPANSVHRRINLWANRESRCATWAIALRRDLLLKPPETGKMRTVSDLACERMHRSLGRHSNSSNVLCATPAGPYGHLIRSGSAHKSRVKASEPPHSSLLFLTAHTHRSCNQRTHTGQSGIALCVCWRRQTPIVACALASLRQVQTTSAHRHNGRNRANFGSPPLRKFEELRKLKFWYF